FGLAQLHQLRGRVGRGKYKSTCILVSADTNPQTNERLNIIVKNSDGFKIADEDYRLRGPGDIFGSRQHGLPSLRCANLAIDSEVIKETHIAAENLMKNNPSLEGVEYDLLKKNVNYMFSKGITLN
ncbi:MAG: ATP-dependent DNA helicase RecG, partial [Clostridia bacterium]|nr:ATP-dependent DNA helicase RecG [Clostridia bacterium]